MPVLSRATCSTCPSASQWSSSLSPLVVVAKARIDFSTVPFGWLSSRHPTTVFWCTSKPQQRSCTICIRSLLSGTASACETESSSGAERGAGAKPTSSFTCSPVSQGATLISSERTRISFELGFFDTIIQRSRLAALLDSTPFSSSSLTATSWRFERKSWAEGHHVEHSAKLPAPMPKLYEDDCKSLCSAALNMYTISQIEPMVS